MSLAKSIKVTETTHKELVALKTGADTIDDVIQMLLAEHRGEAE